METEMALSNSALMDELQATARGQLNIVYKAISLTPEKKTGFFGQKARRVEDVKDKIRELLREESNESLSWRR
jgi:hypothetical protein